MTRNQVFVLGLVVLIFLGGAARSEANTAAETAQKIVAAGGVWTVLDVQRPRFLGSLGRVHVLVQKGEERYLLKFSHGQGDAATLAKGDVVTFTLAPTLEGRGVEGLPAIGMPWGGKAPNPHVWEPGSYLVPHRRR